MNKKIESKEKFDLTHQLKELFRYQSLAVLATQGDDYPYTNLVAFAVTDDLRVILFSTTRSTRKYTNITKNPNVSMLINNQKNEISDFRDAMAVTVIGKGEEILEPEKKDFLRIYLLKHPYLVDFSSSPTNAFFKINVHKYIIVRRFQNVVEMDIDEEVSDSG